MKFLVVKRKHILFIVVTFLLISLLTLDFGGTVYASVFFGDNVKKYPIYSVATQKKQVAISFDAAWGADKTEKIMEVLNEFNINATFFLVGMWVDKYKDIAQSISDKGYEIGSHSYNHPDMIKLNKEKMLQELKETNNIIKSVTGKDVKLFRPPFGSYNNMLIDTLSELNMTAIQWDVDTLDWKGLGPSAVIARVTSKVKNGSIILCHNNADYVIENTRIIVTTLLNKGYTFVTVGELVKDVKSVKIGVGYDE